MSHGGGRVHRLALVALALVPLAWLVLAVGHLDDRYSIDAASGASASLASLAGDGVLYPELFDGSYYAGTRYMPFGTVLHAGLAAATGDLVIGGKLLSGLSAAAVAGLLVMTMRRMGTPTVVAIGLTALLVATRPFAFTSFNMRSDALATALQLGAMLLVWARTDQRSTVLGGVLAGLAILTKFTSLWGLVGGALWLWSARRSGLTPFAAAAAATLGVGGAIALLWSRGRMFENIVGLGGPDILRASAVTFSVQHHYAAVRYSGWLTAALLLAGGVAWLLGVFGRGTLRETPFAPAAAVAAAVSLVVFTDWGAWINHLLDLLALSVLALAALAADHRKTFERRPAVVAIGTAGVAIVAATLYLLPQAARVGVETEATTIDPLVGAIAPGTPVLTEDPWLSLVRDQRPVVLDPYMYRYVAQDHPAWDAALVERVVAHEFGAIVLDRPLSDTSWYLHYFSPDVLEAIDAHYLVTGHVGSHDVYTPR